jgi:hypothetical protein
MYHHRRPHSAIGEYIWVSRSSTLHSPTGPSGVRADCTDELDSAQTVRTPHEFGSPHKNCTMRELNQAPGTNSHLQGGTLYHCAIEGSYT